MLQRVQQTRELLVGTNIRRSDVLRVDVLRQ